MSVGLLRLTQDPIKVSTANRADSLSHPGALFVDPDLALRFAFFLALYAVELAAPGLSHEGLLA
jgi:hypothetical protein